MLMDKNYHELRSGYNSTFSNMKLASLNFEREELPSRKASWIKGIECIPVKDVLKIYISKIKKSWIWYQKGRGSKFHSLNTQFNFWNPHPFSSHKLDCWGHKTIIWLNISLKIYSNILFWDVQLQSCKFVIRLIFCHFYRSWKDWKSKRLQDYSVYTNSWNI